jgi:hypothetical protein
LGDGWSNRLKVDVSNEMNGCRERSDRACQPVMIAQKTKTLMTGLEL